jgi:hypothetical protein
MKKDAAMHPNHAPYFTFHAASNDDAQARMPDIVAMKRSPSDKAANEERRSPSRTIIIPESLKIQPANKQPWEYPINIKNDDKVVEEPKLEKREYIPNHDEHRREKAETNVIAKDSPSTSYAKRFDKKEMVEMDTVSKDIHVTPMPIEQSMEILSSVLLNHPESKIKLNGEEPSAEVLQKQAINLQDRSVMLKAPVAELHHSAMSPEFSSEQSIQPSSLRSNELSSFTKISEPVNVQTPISRFEIVYKMPKEFDDAEDKRPAKIMPALAHPSIVSGFEKGSIEPRGPDQVNVSIGTIEIKAEAPQVSLPAEPLMNYGFGEYAAIRRYSSWERSDL